MKRIVLFLPFMIIAFMMPLAVNRVISDSGLKLYVSTEGKDTNPGTKDRPLRTLQHALDTAIPGTTIYIMPGIYRESVSIEKGGKPGKPITVTSDESKTGIVEILGSEPSSRLEWKMCSNITCSEINLKNRGNVYVTTLVWQEQPHLLFERLSDGSLERLNLARAPNYKVTDQTRYQQHWWVAVDSVLSTTTLTDKSNLTSLQDVSNATAFISDGGSRCGSAFYQRLITKHDRRSGELQFTEPVGFSIFGSQEQGIGPDTTYYIEGKLSLLDAPGEWYFDKEKKLLYLWPFEQGNPKDLNIEIGRRSFAFFLNGISNIVIDGLSLKYFNRNSDLDKTGAIILLGKSGQTTNSITINKTEIAYSHSGIKAVSHNTQAFVNDVTIENADVHHIDYDPVFIFNDTDSTNNLSVFKILNSRIANNSFIPESIGVNIIKANNILISGNAITDHGTFGIHISGYERNPEVAHGISVTKNTVKGTCYNLTSCAGIKFYGGKFTNTRIEGNIIQNSNGWTYCQAQRDGKGSAHGVFISNASGIKVQNNISVDHTGSAYLVYPRQIPAYGNSFINNLAGNSDFGLFLSNPNDAFDYDVNTKNTRHNDTVVRNNVFWDNRIGFDIDPADEKSVSVDYNAYIDNEFDLRFRNKAFSYSKAMQLINNWDAHSITTQKSAFINPDQGNFNLAYQSPLRARGEPSIPFFTVRTVLNLLGFGSDIGPCQYKWFTISCPIL